MADLVDRIIRNMNNSTPQAHGAKTAKSGSPNLDTNSKKKPDKEAQVPMATDSSAKSKSSENRHETGSEKGRGLETVIDNAPRKVSKGKETVKNPVKNPAKNSDRNKSDNERKKGDNDRNKSDNASDKSNTSDNSGNSINVNVRSEMVALQSQMQILTSAVAATEPESESQCDVIDTAQTQNEAQVSPVFDSCQNNNNNNENLLSCLTDGVKQDDKLNPPLESDLAVTINNLLSMGPEEEKVTELKELYKAKPENCEFLVVPKCPPEIWSAANDQLRSKDLKLQRVQNPLTKGITACAMLMDKTMKSLRGKGECVTLAELLPRMEHAVLLLMAANNELKVRRKELWRNDFFNDNSKSLCSQSRPVTDSLFGAGLGEAIKEIGETTKISSQIKKDTNTFKPKNRFHPYNKNQAGDFLGQKNWQKPNNNWKNSQQQQQQLEKLQHQLLGTWFPLETLSIKLLTWKLVMLILLATAQRCQTIHMLKLANMTIDNDRVVFRLDSLLKQSAPGRRLPEISLPRKIDNVNLCVVSTLLHYIDRTKTYRKDINGSLFISIVKPYQPVTKTTLAKWAKQVLQLAGIDNFNAHSTRAASTSKANKCNVSIETIMKTAGWQNAKTFCKYYKRDICTLNVNKFADTVLSCD